MLVLSRRVGTTIRIGDDIYVTVVRVNRGRVLLGITAPQSLLINRIDGIPVPVKSCCDVPPIHDIGGEGGGA